MPAVGHGSGMKAMPARATSMTASASRSGMASGLTGDTASVSTSVGLPMTVDNSMANFTSPACCTTGPCTGFVVCGSVWRYMASDISSPGTSHGVKDGTMEWQFSERVEEARRVAHILDTRETLLPGPVVEDVARPADVMETQ